MGRCKQRITCCFRSIRRHRHGLSLRYSIKHPSTPIPVVVPITAIESRDLFYKKKYKRQQLPLEPQFFGTAHGNQGVTNSYGVVFELWCPTNQIFAPFIEYVMIGRATDFNNVYPLGLLSAKHFTSHGSIRNAVARE